MIKTSIVTLLGSTVFWLASGMLSPAEASSLQKVQKLGSSGVVSADQVTKEAKPDPKKFGISVYVSRNTSLYDFQDGTRKDSTERVPGSIFSKARSSPVNAFLN